MNNAGIDFHDYWHMLERRKFRLLLILFVGCLVGLAVNQEMPIRYSSEALLEVEAHSPVSSEINPGALGTTYEQIKTQVDVLSSRALADAIVSELNLAGEPEFDAAGRAPTWLDRVTDGLQTGLIYLQNMVGMSAAPADPRDAALELFRRRLRVTANEKSHVVAIGFQTGSAALSAKVLNTLLARYLADQVAGNLALTAEQNHWLTAHLATLQQDVDDAAAKAEAFRNTGELVDVAAGSISAVQLNERQQTLSTARQELARAQAAYDTAAAQSKTGSGFAGQEALGSVVIQQLRMREAEVRQRLASLQQRNGDTSPFMPPVVAELNSVRQEIATQTAQIVSALGRDVELARARVNTLQAMVTTSQQQAQRGLSGAATLAQLNQAVEARRHVYIAFLTRMEQTQLATTSFPSAHVVSAAVAQPKPDGPPKWVAVLGGGIGATFGAIVFFVLRFMQKGRISSSKDMELLTGLVPVGAMPALPGAGGMPIPMRILDMAQSGTVETLHAVRFAIQGMNLGPRCTRVLVTSSKEGEGKTTLAASLARLSAASGMRVLLIEADLRRPTLSKMLHLSSRISIELLFSKDLSLADAVQVDRKSGLHCLVSDGSTQDAIITLQSPRFNALMMEAESSYDMVIIDSPPVMRVIDPLILSKYSDVILFAVASGDAPSTLVIEALHRFPIEVRSRIATVLTRVPQSETEWQHYYAGYRRKLPAPALV